MTRRPKVVLITGASSGIGKAAAIEMRRRGWRIFATVRRQTDLIELTQVGRGIIEPLLMDVSDPASIDATIAIIRERAGRLDALVNNAGIAIPGPVESLSDEDLHRQFDVNLFGMHRVTRAALPLLRASRGRIVNISSVSGKVTFPFLGAYAASKHAVEALSDALRMELRGLVKVIVIEPGAVTTPLWYKGVQTEYDSEHYPVEAINRIKGAYLKFGEQGVTPEKVARAIGNALELPWPLARWVVVRRLPFAFYLLRLLPPVFTDWLKLRAVGWRPGR